MLDPARIILIIKDFRYLSRNTLFVRSVTGAYLAEALIMARGQYIKEFNMEDFFHCREFFSRDSFVKRMEGIFGLETVHSADFH